MRYTEEEQNLIVLSSFEELTYASRQSFVEALKSFTSDFAPTENQLIKRGEDGVYNKVRDLFYDPAYRKGVLALLERRGVECVTLASENYPEPLKHISNPPLTLFMRGDRTLLKKNCFAIVGSRRTTPNMLAECAKFSKELSQAFTIVTGSAPGADSAALEGAGGRAISVIAFGFDYLKSASNSQLIKKVESEGLIVSEYYPTTAPRKHYFPVRNRIIAGLSKGALIVSAGKKSGALITAGYAADYGREVFAFPYGLGVSSGEGCNHLIKNGANLCLQPLDILSAFGLDLKPSEKAQLTPEEEKLLAMIEEQGEAFVPALADKLGVPPYKLIPLLSSLEIKKLIVRLGGNRYSILT